MNFESLLSGVIVFLRPDKLAPLSTDDDKEEILTPQDKEGDWVDGEETLETTFPVPLLLTLSREVEAILLEEDDKTGTAGLTAAFLIVSCFVPSDPVGVLTLRPPGESATAFLISETFDLVAAGLEVPAGKEALLISGRERRVVSEEAGLLTFLPPAEPTLFCAGDVFWEKLPVLFLLVAAAELEVLADPVAGDLLTLETEAESLFRSILFLLDNVGLANRAVSIARGFLVFVTDLGVSGGVTSEGLLDSKRISPGLSLLCSSGSSILVSWSERKIHAAAKGK